MRYKYCEKNLSTGQVTTNYYLGDKLVAVRKGTDLRYVQQDHLTGTTLMTDGAGNSTDGKVAYRGTRTNSPTSPGCGL